MEESNDRVINQLIVAPVLTKVAGGGCNQLQMGLTELKPGSVWNTMPQHVHNRRMEAYFYFNVPEGQAICHQMGRPQEQRLVWLHNEQAITAPEWSVHSAAGTSNYMFIWGMGGENPRNRRQVFQLPMKYRRRIDYGPTKHRPDKRREKPRDRAIAGKLQYRQHFNRRGRPFSPRKTLKITSSPTHRPCPCHRS